MRRALRPFQPGQLSFGGLGIRFAAYLIDSTTTTILTLLLLLAAAALLFLITCANAAGLLLARSVARARETADSDIG